MQTGKHPTVDIESAWNGDTGKESEVEIDEGTVTKARNNNQTIHTQTEDVRCAFYIRVFRNHRLMIAKVIEQTPRCGRCRKRAG